MAAYLIGALLSRYYFVFVGCNKSSTRLLSMLICVALAYVHPLYRGDSQVAAYSIGALLFRYYSVCVGCNKSSTRLLSMLAYVALAFVHPLYHGVS